MKTIKVNYGDSNNEQHKVEVVVNDNLYETIYNKAINDFLDAIRTYDTFGYDGTKMFRLNDDNANDYVPYIHYDDVIYCAEETIKREDK